MKRIILILVALSIFQTIYSQTLSGTYLNIWSTDSHLGQFGFYDNSGGQTRPRVDIWGYPSKINFRTTYNTGGAALSFGTNSVNDALFINENGNIGIGTTTTYGRLTSVTANGTYAGVFLSNDGSGGFGGIAIKVNSDAQRIHTEWWTNIHNVPLILGTYYHQNMLCLNPNGNVGIGVTDPTSPLTVNGNILSNSLMIDNHQSGDYAYAFYLKADRDLTKAFAICDKNSNEVFRVYGNGITFAKKVFAEAFEVRPDAVSIWWYDHVFSPNYKLKSLHEVEQYVKEYKHLPEIPSEKEVKGKGFNMAEMDGLLLKKIEELTLYVIQQQKEIEQLKQQLAKND